MNTTALLSSIGIGFALEFLVYFVLKLGFRLSAKASAAVVAMAVLLFYVPYGILTWPGADIFAIHLAIFLTTAYAMGLIGARAGRGWHWGPAIIVTFFIGVIVINIVFVGVAERGITGVFAAILPEPRGAAVADSQFPGTVSHDFQEKEALYNAYLEDVEEQHERGWQVKKGWKAKPVVAQPATLVVTVADKAGIPLTDAKVHGRFLRTSNSREDFDFDLSNVGGGEYQFRGSMPLPGLWQMVLWVKRGDDVHEIRGMTAVQGPGGTG